MVDAGIGRLLVASLHQGIADVAPTRLAFYENWLTPPGLRSGRFGLAALHAVLSFLRGEGQVSYERVMRRAGQCSADWGYEELGTLRRALVRRLPPALRAHAALHVSRRLVRHTFRGSHARVRVRRGSGKMDIRASVFCAVRERAAWPMCVFYAAAVERVLQRFDLDAQVELTQCRASGGEACTMSVIIRGHRATAPAVEAA